MSKDYNLLKLLVTLYETRQTTATARKLNISQPTVSVMLKKLREQFSDELFVRNSNRLEPTQKCTDLVNKIPNILDQLDQLYTDKAWSITQQQGEIALYFPATLMAPIAAPLLAKLTSLAPKLTVSCHPWHTNSLQVLEQNRNAWGVGYLPMEVNKNVYEQSLPDDRFILVTRQDHPLNDPTLEDILQYPICVSVIPGYIEASKVEMLIKKYKFDKNVNTRCGDMSMMLELIRLSDSIGVISIKNKPLLSEQFKTFAIPQALYHDTFRRQCSLFCHLRDRNHPFTEWLHSNIGSLMQS
ncbi:LysR family transcriptional regulator [Vibrio sp. FNV 38]|nr:LysR family transcriptional regulator [Vibrio sp. FNV 38]